MKKNYNKDITRKLAAYSAMAAALTAVATEADAQVVYTDIPDETIEVAAVDEIFPVDMDANGMVDFVFRAGTANSGTWTFASIYGMFSSLSAGNPNNQVVASIGVNGFAYALTFDNGYAVEAGDDFFSSTSISNYAILASNYDGYVYGNFGDAGAKFIALQFDIDGDVHYGWIRVDVTLSPISVTIMDYAYDATAGVSINTGDTTGGGVAINTLPELVRSVYSFGNIVHINLQKNEGLLVNIYNITGQKVYAESVSGLSMEIDLNNMAGGNYVVELVNEYGMYSKTVNISK